MHCGRNRRRGLAFPLVCFSHSEFGKAIRQAFPRVLSCRCRRSLREKRRRSTVPDRRSGNSRSLLVIGQPWPQRWQHHVIATCALEIVCSGLTVPSAAHLGHLFGNRRNSGVDTTRSSNFSRSFHSEDHVARFLSAESSSYRQPQCRLRDRHFLGFCGRDVLVRCSDLKTLSLGHLFREVRLFGRATKRWSRCEIPVPDVIKCHPRGQSVGRCGQPTASTV